MRFIFAVQALSVEALSYRTVERTSLFVDLLFGRVKGSLRRTMRVHRTSLLFQPFRHCPRTAYKSSANS